jgi:hypothetical protein
MIPVRQPDPCAKWTDADRARHTARVSRILASLEPEELTQEEAEHQADELREARRHAGMYRGVEIEARLYDGGAL